jgi:tetratricopeptide (TPR) repeat protein
MDISSERGALQEIVDRVATYEAKEHLWITLKALKLLEYGYVSFSSPHRGGVIGFYEEMIQELTPVTGAEMIRALVQSALMAEYGKAGDFQQALANGRAALPVLAKDSRMAYACAQCLHDLGATLYQMGEENEAVRLMEQALSIYDNLPDRSRGEVCRSNLARLRGAHATDKRSGSFWSRLFGAR